MVVKPICQNGYKIRWDVNITSHEFLFEFFRISEFLLFENYSRIWNIFILRKVSKETWTDQQLNEQNYGIHGTVTAKISSRPASQTGENLKKLNWPTASNGGAVQVGQSVTYLTCWKENRLDKSTTKFTTFKAPTKKVTCGLHENRCFSSTAHVKENSNSYIQYAYRGCLNANATILEGQDGKPYYVRQ